MFAYARNKHDIEGIWSHSGSMYGSQVSDPMRPGHTYWQSCIPLFVPKCCLSCPFYDDGERDDMGYLVSAPYCERNIWFPVKKGTCVVRDREIDYQEQINPRELER